MSQINTTETYDLVVVGSGWFGLAAARAYIQNHPQDRIAILESNETVGGTWSKARLYPGLKSNNMLGSYEYPDFPMHSKVYGVSPGGHIPGAVLNRYLTDFARHFGILERLQFRTTVSVVEPTPTDGWRLTAETPNGQKVVETSKLILATGLTSTPNMPVYAGAEHFDKPLFHAKDFCTMAPKLKDVKHAVVVGGAKSAFDVAYAMVESGATVDLVIRPNGHGPVWIAPRYVTPLKKRIDTILNVRFMTWFSPCPWGGEDGYSGPRRFLHSTILGRFLVKAFWKVLGSDVLTANQYESHPELMKLQPWHPVFWIGSGLSIQNYDTSFFDMVKQGKVRVHVENIDRLEPGKVVLTSGTTLEADTLICSTGWKKESTIKFRGLKPDGLSLRLSEEEQALVNAQFDKKVLDMFPILAQQPELRFQPPLANPLRNYRFIVPSAYLEKRNLAYAGMISSVSTAICAAAQGMWISAHFDNKLDRVARTREQVIQEVMLHTQWGKWRYPCGYGASLPDFVFEGIPYVDMLLKDLGLKNHRKDSFFAELTSPYTPKDYAGVHDEWVNKHALVK
ncbi:putative dimethylaniline monooxygenase, partial [Aureobasidium melanogenum]